SNIKHDHLGIGQRETKNSPSKTLNFQIPPAVKRTAPPMPNLSEVDPIDAFQLGLFDSIHHNLHRLIEILGVRIDCVNISIQPSMGSILPFL
ncbi:hypothetical protein, partial [Mycobacterium uberis]|uniref:hypothetical protein n=1 Tax=Mycobacterium uberis TaxID=2162698 RepID=UPI001A9E4E9E